MGFLSNLVGAVFDTLREEAPAIAKQLVVPKLREAVRKNAPAPAQPWAIKRIIAPAPKLNSVHDKVTTMPPEWRGWAKTKRVIVFHDADKAGPHVEMYIEWKGQAYNVGVKRLNAQRMKNVKYNNKGELTQASRDYLIDLMRAEYRGQVDTGSFLSTENGKPGWLGQSTDHKPSEARESWKNYDPGYQKGYGSGRARFVLADDDIVVWKMGETIEGRDHLMDPDRDFYIHRPFDKTMKIGLKHNRPPKLNDRLHLKPFIGQETWDKFRSRVGPKGTMTIKHDGASAYFEVTKHGLRLWSPRKSKATGEQIEYTHKVKDLRNVKLDQRSWNDAASVTGMGELLFHRNGKYLKAHEIGGLLNSHDAIPDDVTAEFVIYRVDRIGRRDVLHEAYEDNLKHAFKLQAAADRQKIEGLKTPTVVLHDEALEHAADHEGLVGIPAGASLVEGMKFKPRGDDYDWTLREVAFENGDKGGVAGVAWFENDAGQRFKIGASSMGTHENAREMMSNPDSYVGRVAKVSCYQGHEGRAARFVAWHDAKGVA